MASIGHCFSLLKKRISLFDMNIHSPLFEFFKKGREKERRGEFPERTVLSPRLNPLANGTETSSSSLPRTFTLHLQLERVLYVTVILSFSVCLSVSLSLSFSLSLSLSLSLSPSLNLD